MRKIIVGAQLSLDGIMQAPGGPTEDPTKNFKFGGWAMPYFDQTAGEEINRLFAEPFDLLLGRKTYEIFAAYWPYYNEDAKDGDIAKRFNRITKYVVSSAGKVDTSWNDTVLLRNVDDISTFTVPVILGHGKKLFADGAAPHSYTLSGSRVADTGMVVAHYERAGEVKTADAARDTPSDKERARQERMKYEG